MVEISAGNVVSNNISAANQNHRSGLYRDGEGKEKEMLWSEPRVAPSRYLKIYHAGDGRGIYVSSAPDTKVLHNTVYANEAEGICVEGPPRTVDGITMSTRGSVVLNNIIAFNHGSQLTITVGDGAPESGTVSDYNLIFSLGALLAKKGWEGPGHWRWASGKNRADKTPIRSTPTRDLRRPRWGISACSLAALQWRRGDEWPNVSADYFGRARNAEKPSLGAAEGATLNYPAPAWPKNRRVTP